MTRGRAAYQHAVLVLAVVCLLPVAGATLLAPAADAFEPHSPYSATTNSCAVCHDVHGSTVGRKLLGPDGGTAVTETDVCFTCHGTGGSSGWDVESAGVPNSFGITPGSGHSVEEAAADPDLTNYCSSCHGPHGDPNDGDDDLPKIEINGFTVDRAIDPNSWCEACHDPERPAAENWSGETGDAYYNQIFTSRDADTYITFGTFRGWDAYYDTSAHSLIPADSFENPVNANDTVVRAEGDCLWCHSSHRSENTYDNLVGEFGPTSWAVCDDCHLVLNPAGDWGTGHIIDNAASPLDGLPLPCYECHNAHGSKNGNTMLAQDSLGQLLNPDSTSTTYTVETQAQFCYTCHLSSDGYGWNSWDATMQVWDNGSGGGLQSQSGITTTVAGIARADMVQLPARIKAHQSSEMDKLGCKCHGSVHAPNPKGVPAGGQSCYNCHPYEASMEYDGDDRQLSYHHVLGSTTFPNATTPFAGDEAAAFYKDGSYPTTYTAAPGGDTDVYCLSCHVDHDKFYDADGTIDNRGANLRSGLVSSPTAYNSDFNSADTDGGVCLGCHKVSLAKDLTNQKPGTGTAGSGQSATTPAITKGDYLGKAHDYVVPSTFPEGSSFNANCVKCHNDEEAQKIGAAYTGYQVSGASTPPYKFGTHWSGENRLAAALTSYSILTASLTSTEETLCFKCHDGDTSDGKDGYGVTPNVTDSMTIRSGDVRDLFFKPNVYTHGVDDTVWDGVHTSDEVLFSGSNKHVECEDCHNPHAAGVTVKGDTVNGVSLYGGTDGNVIGSDSPLLGVLGADVQDPPNPPNGWPSAWSEPSVDTALTATREYQICFKCHSDYNEAYNPGTGSAGMNSTFSWNDSGTDGTVEEWTNVALEFNPNNPSYHPVVAPLGNDQDWLDSHMKSEWLVENQTMMCSDCHRALGDSPAAYGPHGSSVKHILRGYWPTDSAAGDPKGTYYSLKNRSDTNMLCAQCHNMNNFTAWTTAHTGQHVSGRRDYRCIDCHLLVPHGGNLPGLVGDGSAALRDSEMPARYARDAVKTNTFMSGYSGNPFSYNSCGCSDRHGELGTDW